MLGSFCPRTRPGRFARERVAMAMRDKHCQTYHEESEVISDPVRVMYDETVEVNAREVDSPSSSDEEVVKAAMSKFNPPARHTARHDFDSESESDSDPENENFLNNIKRDASPERKPPEKAELSKQSSKDESVKGRSTSKRADSSENSESDSAELGLDRPLASGRKRMGVVIPAEGAYDPKQYQDLKVPADMENIFQYIMKYTPQKIDIEFKLQPFVPEYVPAVGDIDAFLKVTTPARGVRGEQLGEQFLEHIDNLGLMVLDEPAAEQSESALLHLQLRALSKTSAKPTMVTKKLENAEKNGKALDRWIKDVSELHRAKPPPTVAYSRKMPDIDTLMEEWPASVERALDAVGVPPAGLACSLAEYADLVCGVFDIPVADASLAARVAALHLLFALYTHVKNSQLYAERQNEEKDSGG
ncbi:intraflagellar transport protein 46 homolog isoform X1 [Cydia pomonella]|uniref:intraflagellar transport protein 46 homolog isoform X1 n=1 Tax=Cydia pomonella TaxID=82600 RepID=UPI002ADD9E38|nr:intraflagellar transport protein 46 homolog isoform X1 [Cydia pomonella]